MKQTIALIDGDIFCYEAASSAEEALCWGDGLWTLHAWEEPAKAKLEDRIRQLTLSIGAERTIVALSDDHNWRKDVLPTYKANRAPTRKPMLLPLLKQHIKDTFETFVRPSLEADDVLGILATWPGLPGRKVIVTIDKDLQTIPGLHYYTNRPEQGVFEVTKDEADRRHLLQSLTGDATDGYTGCPGIGATAAEEFLSEPFITYPEERALKSGPRKGQLVTEWKKRPLEANETLWDGIVSLFAKAGLGPEEALTQARVARICRASDYDFTAKEVRLWTP